jgi:hypothetical protein
VSFVWMFIHNLETCTFSLLLPSFTAIKSPCDYFLGFLIFGYRRFSSILVSLSKTM